MLLLLALLTQQHTITINDPVPPDNVSVDNTFVCNGSTKITASYSNDWARGKRGIVSSVKIAGTEVPGIREHLTEVAHNRAIQSITVRQCGPSEAELRVAAEMELSNVESTRDGLPQLHFFKFDREGLVKQ